MWAPFLKRVSNYTDTGIGFFNFSEIAIVYFSLVTISCIELVRPALLNNKDEEVLWYKLLSHSQIDYLVSTLKIMILFLIDIEKKK